MTMEIELGSIMRHCVEVFKDVKAVYTKRIPEGMKFPSMYFPAPATRPLTFTSSAYKKLYILNVKLFHDDSQQAFIEAEKIADSIRANRNLMQLYDETGESINKRLFMTSTDVRVIEEKVAQITFTWESIYNFNQETYEKMKQINYRIEESMRWREFDEKSTELEGSRWTDFISSEGSSFK